MILVIVLVGDAADAGMILFTIFLMVSALVLQMFFQSAGRADIQCEDADAIWRAPVMFQHSDAPAFTFASEHLQEAAIRPEVVQELR